MEITWKRMITAEPELEILLMACNAVDKTITEEYQRSKIWYHVFKPAYAKLVGYGRERGPEWMQKEDAWDIGYRKLINALEC
jgi:hypothetical protein